MIDHETARRSFATSLDFTLDPAEREALDEHLGGCPACRAEVAALRSDGAVLRDLDLGPVPIAVRANIAIAAEHRQGGGSVGRWIAIVGVGALLIVALGGGVLGVGGRPSATRDPGHEAVVTEPHQIDWKTEVVTLTAREFSIVAGGKTFRAATPKVDVNSDPGDATSRTLETTWFEDGIEVRLNFYFANDATASWVSGIQVYDGALPGEWLVAKGAFFKTPVGAAWVGDQDIELSGPDGPGRLHLAGLTLVNRPSNVIGKPGSDTDPKPIVVPIGSDPFAAGGSLRCSGILRMTPQDAQATLLKLGLPITWQYKRNDGSLEPRKEPPAGTVIIEDGPFIGSEGQLQITVVDQGSPLAQPVPLPDDCLSGADPNPMPPSPAP
jgi:hypothetical protein